LFSLCLIGGAALLLGMSPNTSLLRIIGAMALIGVAMGVSTVTLLVAVQDTASFEIRGVATSALTFFRALGGALGIGAGGALFNRRVEGLEPFWDGGGALPFNEGIRVLLDPEKREILTEAARSDLAHALGFVCEPVWLVAFLAGGVCILLAPAWFFTRTKTA